MSVYTTADENLDKAKENKMLLSTTDTIVGKQVVEHRGMVHASQWFKLGGDASYETGGDLGNTEPNVDYYVRTLEAARQKAIRRLIQAATNMGANAIVGVRFSTAPHDNLYINEVIVYGTAVRVAE